MKNKIALMCVLIILMLPQIVGANTIELNEPQQQQDETVLISGRTNRSLKRRTVSVIVFFDGKSEADVTEGRNENTVAFAKNVKTEPDGTFSVIWDPSKNGLYDIKVALGSDICQYNGFWYTSLKELKKLQNILLLGDKESVEGVLSDTDNLNTLEIDQKLLQNCSIADTAEALIMLREHEQETSDAVKYVEDAVKLSRLKTEKSEEALSVYTEILEKYGVAFDNKSEFDGLTNSAVKENVLINFSEKSIEKFESANDFIKTEIILTGIEKSLWKEAEKYIELMDKDILEGCQDKTYVMKKIAGERYSSLNELRGAVDEYIEDLRNEQSNKHKNDSPSGGGGGKSVSMKLETTKKENDNENQNGDMRKVFADVPEVHWAFNAINYLRWNNIISGDLNNRFNPENNVSRAELVKMLVCTFKVKGNECDFTDVTAKDWFYNYVAAAFSNGLINGTNGNFHPNDAVTRQDAAVIIYRFAQNSGKKYQANDLLFEDEESISEYAKDAVAALSSAGVINGTDEKHFSPLEPLTRAQSAKLIYGIIADGGVLQ